MQCEVQEHDQWLLDATPDESDQVSLPHGMALRAHDLGKCYRLYRRARERLTRLLFRAKQFDAIWALRHVYLEVNQGQTVGIIGPNGSGKSTLLQMVAGTLAPTEGYVAIRGRVAALLELGSGFNPDFTGRDNVFMNAGILGLSRREIAERFDDIAAFADIGAFMDHPLKTYSSGMAVRLAFSVAVSVQPDVLIVDEALAVGDIRFQQRCMSRIRHMRDQGVSILFVTHDLEAAKRLCDQIHVLESGRLIRSGSPDTVANWYLGHMTSGAQPSHSPAASALNGCFTRFRHGDGNARITGTKLINALGEACPHVRIDEEHTLQIDAEFLTPTPTPVVGWYLRDRLGTDIIGVNTFQEGIPLPAVLPGDRLTVRFRLPFNLRPGHYAVSPVVAYNQHEMRYMDWVDNALVFEVIDPVPGRTVFGLVRPDVTVDFELHQASAALMPAAN